MENSINPRLATNPRWKKLKALFEQAIELPPQDRQSFVDSVEATHSSLGLDLRRLLSQHDVLGDFMEEDYRAAFPTFESGQKVAQRYEIVRQIGRGGMGEVYEAVDLELNENIA